MIVVLLALLGAVIGGLTARRRKGSGADIAQYAAVYGILFALIGLVLTIALEKILL
ncbi:apolipoprotein acyltransferase [Roseivivax sp. CAU 1761]